MQVSSLSATKYYLKLSVWVTLSLLLILGGFLRLYHLGDQSYWMDEGYTINAVLSVEEHGSTVLDSGKNYSCPTYCYPTAFIAEHFGNSPTSYRLLAAIAGIAFIVLIFFIAQIWFGTWVGLISAGLIALSYFQIAWSRQARWYTLFELFFWAALFSFYKTLHQGKYRTWWAAATIVLTITAILTHGIGWILPFFFTGWFCFDRYISKRNGSRKEIGIATVGIIAVAALLWFMPFQVSLVGLLQGVSFHYELPYYLSFYLRHYWLLTLPAILVVAETRAEHRWKVWMLLTIVATYLIPFSFLTGIVHYRYLFHLTPAIFILAALGLQYGYTAIKNKYVATITFIIFVVLFFISGVGVLAPHHFYTLESDNPSTLSDRPYYAYTPQSDWTAAYAYINEHEQPRDIIVSSMPQFNKIFLGEPGYWIAYDYLGFDNRAQYIYDGKEYYVGAKIVEDSTALTTLMQSGHGYVVLDSMAEDRIDSSILKKVHALPTVFEKTTNSYSQIRVYRF